MMKVSGLIEWVEVGQGGSPPKEKKKTLLNAFLARRRREKWGGEEKIEEGGGARRYGKRKDRVRMRKGEDGRASNKTGY